jgi:hypothetical protein
VPGVGDEAGRRRRDLGRCRPPGTAAQHRRLARRARTDAQTTKVAVLRPDGSEKWGGQGAFPTTAETIDPGAYAIIDDDALAASLLPGQGYTLRVTVNPGTQVESSRDFKFDVNDQYEWTRG